MPMACTPVVCAPVPPDRTAPPHDATAEVSVVVMALPAVPAALAVTVTAPADDVATTEG